MSYSLIVSAFLMGLVGLPHCLAMCGAACAAIAANTRLGGGEQTIHFAQNPAARWQILRGASANLLFFHVGRAAGYAALGALAAASMQGLGWLTVQSAAFRPVWTMLHIAIGVIGFYLLITGRQPYWINTSAQAVWQWVQRVLQRQKLAWPQAPGAAPEDTHPQVIKNSIKKQLSLFGLGASWALLPCGLLYSAIMLAALANQVWQGALVMVAFALGTSVGLTLGPLGWLHWRLRQGRTERGQKIQAWATRFSGLLLILTSAAALWLGLVHQQAPWCVV